jgi:hypothetical protein
MRLSRETGEALLLIGGFLFVVACGYLAMRLWPTHEFGNWRLLIAIGTATGIAVPAVLKMRSKLIETDAERKE